MIVTVVTTVKSTFDTTNPTYAPLFEVDVPPVEGVPEQLALSAAIAGCRCATDELEKLGRARP